MLGFLLPYLIINNTSISQLKKHLWSEWQCWMESERGVYSSSDFNDSVNTTLQYSTNALPWVFKSHFIKFYHLSWTSSTHPIPYLTPNAELTSPALWAALTGSLREESTFSFHPLLEDKHQSHLAAHPYSWAAYKYLIAASLQLFSCESSAQHLTYTYTHKHF